MLTRITRAAVIGLACTLAPLADAGSLAALEKKVTALTKRVATLESTGKAPTTNSLSGTWGFTSTTASIPDEAVERTGTWSLTAGEVTLSVDESPYVTLDVSRDGNIMTAALQYGGDDPGVRTFIAVRR